MGELQKHRNSRTLHANETFMHGSRYRCRLSTACARASRELLVETQRLLLLFGIQSRVDHVSGERGQFSYTRKDGSFVEYTSKPLYDLRISGPSIARFKEHIGFLTTTKQAKLDHLIATHRFYRERTTARLVKMSKLGFEPTYNLTEPKNHSYCEWLCCR